MEAVIDFTLQNLKGEMGGILALFGMVGAVGGYLFAQKTIITQSADRIKGLKAHIDELESLRAEKRTFSDVLPNIHNVYHHLNEVTVRLGSSRSMVMYTENGGGKPSIGSQLYVSIVYESYSADGGSIRNKFQRVRVDQAYCEMLGYMLTNTERRTVTITSRMPQCMLRDLYINSGTEMSFIYLIKETETRLYYASFNFPHAVLDPHLLYECDLKANQIAQLFREVE